MVGGLEQHVQKLKEMVVLPLLYLAEFDQFRTPKGVLFHGPPGTGWLTLHCLHGLQGAQGHHAVVAALISGVRPRSARLLDLAILRTRRRSATRRRSSTGRTSTYRWWAAAHSILKTSLSLLIVKHHARLPRAARGHRQRAHAPAR